MSLPGKDFQGSKLKVTLARKKGPMNSLRGGIPPREQRGMPPPLRGGTVQPLLSCFPSFPWLPALTGSFLQVQGDPVAQGAPAGPAAPWAGWGEEVETGAASPRGDRGDPGETRPEGVSSTAPGTGSAPTREYPPVPRGSIPAAGQGNQAFPKVTSQEAASTWHRGRDGVTAGGCG